MTAISESEYQKLISSLLSEGFSFDPPEYKRLSFWTYPLMHLVNARANFQQVHDHQRNLGDIGDCLRHQAFFTAGIMAYSRCYASSGSSIPTLDANAVYKGSDEGMTIHRRLIELRNTIAAHTDQSDLMRLTLAVKEESDRVLVRHLLTNAIPIDEVPDFLDAVSHTEHFVTVSINKQLNHLEKSIGKAITLD